MHCAKSLGPEYLRGKDSHRALSGTLAQVSFRWGSMAVRAKISDWIYGFTDADNLIFKFL
jgi:hypothetical protein